jgi:hypothetical protein
MKIKGLPKVAPFHLEGNCILFDFVSYCQLVFWWRILFDISVFEVR